MGWRTWNKMFAVSSSLAAAGMLVCVGALLNSFVPKGSALAAAASMVVLAVAVIAVVAGYVWVCERCEEYLSERLDRRISKASRKPRPQVILEEPRAIDFGVHTWRIPQSPRLNANSYRPVRNLRDLVPSDPTLRWRDQ